jgi:hypothetical protein
MQFPACSALAPCPFCSSTAPGVDHDDAKLLSRLQLYPALKYKQPVAPAEAEYLALTLDLNYFGNIIPK